MTTSFIKTKLQAIQLHTILDSVMQKIYSRGAVSLQKVLVDSLPEEIFVQLSTPFDESTVLSYLASVKDELEKRETLHLILPFYPRVSFLNYIFEEIASKLNSFPILDVEVQDKIKGGFILDIRGKLFDYSLASQVARYIGGNS